MNRDDGRALVAGGIIAVLIVFGAVAIAYAEEPKLPPGYSCDDVRAKVAELGRVRALALALENGATWKQIREARKCLTR